MNRTRFAVLILAVASGCASVKPDEARTAVADRLGNSAGEDLVVENPTEASGEAVRVRVDELLAAPLSSDAAVRIALLNNRGFLATLEELGVAQADLVEAGLLDNPVLAGDLVISTTGNGLGGGFSVSQNLLGILLIPAKRRVAKAQLEKTILQVTRSAQVLVRDVRVAFAAVEQAQRDVALRRAKVQAAEVADELARRQDTAGNLAPRDLAAIGASLDHARLELLDAQVSRTAAREQLNVLLGVWGRRTDWTLAEDRDQLPPPSRSLADAEQRGLTQRLDLSSARYHVQAAEYALQLRRRGVVPQLEVGVEARNEVGNDEGHEWVLGPSMAIELPIFNPGHADFARLKARLRQAEHELAQRSVRARAQIRTERERLLAARRRVDYFEKVVSPRQGELYEATLLQYNGMLAGAYDLLETRMHQLDAEIEQSAALYRYWAAAANFDLATGE